jgi:hypothetical protein
MSKTLDEGLGRPRDTTAAIPNNDIPDESGGASIIVRFSNGTILQATFWRVIKDGKTQLSSFDHGQKYGLPAPIDAKNQLADLLNGKTCQDARCDGETADLILKFHENIKLQVFNFTGYEIWAIHLPDGRGEYSNYALARRRE